MKAFLILITVFLVLSSCNDKIAKSINKFSDSTLVKLYDVQDKRKPAIVAAYFDDDNLQFRQTSLLAFGSIQDTSYLKPLSQKLTDPDFIIRKNAAFALGQMGEISDELIHSISKERDSIMGKANASNRVSVWKRDIG
jgi:HEAT repeat protein